MSRQELRFGVYNEETGLRAATWKLWTPNAKNDIYLTCRQLGGDIKVSFHESGSWHFGFSKDAFDKLVDKEDSIGQSRHFEIWSKPKPLFNALTFAIRIITPFSAINVPIEDIKNNIIRIPSCLKDRAIEIDIIITANIEELDSWPGKTKMGTKYIGSYPIGKTERVWVVHWDIPMPSLPSSNPTLKYFKGKSKADILGSSNLKAILFADAEDGSKVLIDSTVVVK